MTNKCLQLLLLLKDDGSFQLIAFKQLRKHWNSYLNLSLSIVFSVQMKLQYYKLYQGNTSHSYIVCVDSAEIRDQCSGFIKIFLFHWSLIHAKRSIDTHCLLVYVFTTLHKFWQGSFKSDTLCCSRSVYGIKVQQKERVTPKSVCTREQLCSQAVIMNYWCIHLNPAACVFSIIQPSWCCWDEKCKLSLFHFEPELPVVWP